MFDNIPLLTILFIVISTIIGTYVNSRRKDRCLVSFCDFMVTLLQKNDKRVWGYLSVETSGLELLYEKEFRNEGHVETSYILFKEEYDDIFLILRFHDELSEENKRRRIQEVKKAYHPWPLRLFARKVRNIANTCKDSLFELFGLAMTRAKTANPALSAVSSQRSVTRLEKGISSYLGRAYDAVLEKYIGKQVVVEIETPSDELQEQIGIFKDYSRQFLQVMDVSYSDDGKIRLCDIIVPRTHATIRHGAEA